MILYILVSPELHTPVAFLGCSRGHAYKGPYLVDFVFVVIVVLKANRIRGYVRQRLKKFARQKCGYSILEKFGEVMDYRLKSKHVAINKNRSSKTTKMNDV